MRANISSALLAAEALRACTSISVTPSAGRAGCTCLPRFGHPNHKHFKIHGAYPRCLGLLQPRELRELSDTLLWALVIAGGTGLLLGLWLRVPAVLAASAATVVACTVLLPIANWSLLTAILFGFGLSTALQFGYLAGLMLSCALSQAGSWSGLLRSAVALGIGLRNSISRNKGSSS